MIWRRLATLGAWAALGISLCGSGTAEASEILIRGTAVARDGAKLEEGRARLVAQRSRRDRALDRLAGREAETAAQAEIGADGRFELLAPREGMWRVEVEAAGLLPMRFDLIPLIEERTLPAVELRRRDSLEVRVLAPDGEPVAAARVLATTTQAGFWSSARGFPGRRGGWSPANRAATTDAEGIAVLHRADDEELTIRAAAPGLVESAKLDTRAATASLRLAAGRALTIRAVDDRRKNLVDVLARYGEGSWPAAADAEGLVQLTLPADDELALELSDAGKRHFEGSVAFPVNPGPDPVALVLAEPRRLAGRIVDEDTGQAIAGALVWASRDPTGAVYSDGDGGGRGAFSIVVGETGPVHLQAARSGYRPNWLQVSERLPHAPVLALAPAAAIRGRVVDSAGRPVEGATIGVRENAGDRMRMMLRAGGPASPRTRSDADGRFLVTGLEPRKSYQVTAQLDGFAPGEVAAPELEPLGTATGVRIVLESGARLVGRVLDRGGAPVAGARLVLSPAAGGGAMRMIRRIQSGDDSASPEAFSSNDGGFELVNLRQGSFDLEVSAAGFATTTVPGVEVAAAVETVDAGSIVLEPGAEVAGRVIDHEGQPIEGADVWAAEPSPMARMRLRFGGGDGDPQARSAADGHFALADRRPGERIDLVVRRSGYSAEIVSGVEVPPVEPVEVTLQPASNLSGTVTDNRGEPVPNARVQAFAEGGGATSGGAVFMMAMAGFGVADEQGEFTIEDIEPGTVRLSVEAAGFRKTEISNIEVPVGAEVEGLEIEMLEGASLTGSVRGSDGQPVVGARIQVVEQQRGMAMRMGTFGNQSDGAGNYFLEGLEPGIRLIRASHDDQGEVTREAEIEEGENSLDLVFEGGVEVTGRVVDEAGGPLAGAVVSMNSSARFFRGGAEERTGADGTFTFQGVRDGAYRLSAFKQGFAQTDESAGVEVAGQPVYGLEVRLGAGGVITGQIRGLDPAALVTVDVFASSTPTRWASGEVRHDGTYRIEDVGPGDWDVLARVNDGSGQAEGRVTLEPGQPEALLDLEFGSGLRVTGRVLMGTEPVSGVNVTLSGLDVQSNAIGTTGRDGRFSVQGLEPGRHRVSVMDFASGLQHSEEHEIRSDTDIVLELAVSRISGRVLDATDSSPVPAAVVRLEPLGEQDERMRFFNRGGSSDATGLFTIHNVSAGGYRLVAEKEGYSPAELSVQVEADRYLEDLELSLQPTEGVALRVRLPSGGTPSRISAAVVDGGGRVVLSGDYPADQEGRVRLSKVPSGSWRILIGAQGTAVSSFNAVAPGPLLDVRLQPEARLEVQIPDLADDRTMVTIEAFGAGGEPATSFAWNGQVRREWRTGSGFARLGGLEAGAWRVRVSAPDGRVWEERTTVAPGDNPRLVID